MMEQKKPGDKREPKVITVSEMLECVLTDEELLSLGQQLSAAEAEYHRLETRAKESARNFRGQLQTKRGEIHVVSQQINRRSERRRVQVDEIMDYAAGTFKRVRKDTEVVLEERPLSGSELQPELFDEPKDAE